MGDGGSCFRSYIYHFQSRDPYPGSARTPASQNGYSYVHGNPINYTDPTGLCIRGFDGKILWGTYPYGTSGICPNTMVPELPTPGSTASTCEMCGWDDTYGHLGHAYDTFVGFESELGRPLTYEETLVITIYHEYGWLHEGLTDSEFELAVETTGRLLYHFCDSDGICQEDQLWKFLGYHQGFYNKYRPSDIEEGVLMLTAPCGSPDRFPNSTWSAARQILSQPPYDPTNATESDMMNNWRSGYANGLPVPFVYGNYSMFNAITRQALPEAPIGTGVNAVLVNKPYINGGNGYVVMTTGQRAYWRSLGE